MNCSSEDLKGYFLGELASRDKASVEEHVRACQNCREELDRLKLTQTALLALEEEEVPQRIAFVSDKVFEPRWYQTVWRSGPAMAFAAAVILAAAILVHGYARPAGAAPVTSTVDTAQIEQRIEREVGARLDTMVQKAVSDAQAKQAAEFAKVLDASETRFETRRKADLATIQQAAEYYEKQMNRWLVASNDTRAGQ
jgi:anti-sigma factor RsiW